eukprot:9052213-Heterocapsa_arctica.AAC.1
MAHWPDTLLEPKAGNICSGERKPLDESRGVRYHAAHKASTENHVAPGWATTWFVGGFKPLSRVHANERTD